jgi:hypothetical protein
MPVGCRFRDRCPLAEAICAEVDPPAVGLGNGHLSWCHVVPKATINQVDVAVGAGGHVANLPEAPTARASSP